MSLEKVGTPTRMVPIAHEKMGTPTTKVPHLGEKLGALTTKRSIRACWTGLSDDALDRVLG
jgi:hypothetical protein